MHSVSLVENKYLTRLSLSFHQLCAACLMTLLFMTAVGAFAQIVAHPASGQARIRVDADHPLAQTIPRTLFGTFLEPIGDSTYNGLWAEILQNPSFESGLWDATHIQTLVRDEPELLRASELGLPLPWLPLDQGQGNRYEFRYGDAANSTRSLELIGIPGQQVGIAQRVYLPVQREADYHGSLYVRHISGAALVQVSLFNRSGSHAVIASATIDASHEAWTKVPFTFHLEQDALVPLEQAEFRITVEGDTRVLIDQASLMPADAINGLDPDAVAAAQAMHTSQVRFGGNFTSGYHWRDGIGPIDKRVNMPNVAWGIPEYNTFGTDEFLRFCELIHAEPAIALNLGSGTPQEAAEWVRYVNEHWPAQQGGLMWEMGNELWGDWNTGWPTTKQVAPRTLAFSQAIRAVDPKARLIATGQDPDRFADWNALQLANPVGTMNYISTHFVETTDEVGLRNASPAFLTAATMALPDGLEKKLAAMHQQVAGTPQKDAVKIAFTEWLWAGPLLHRNPNYENFAGALTTASMLNMLMRSSDAVPISDMTGIMEFEGIWKKRGIVYRTPAAYAFGMIAGAPAEHLLPVHVNSGTYTVHNGSSRIPEIDDVPFLDVDAAISADRKTITLFVVNRDQEHDLATTLNIAGLAKKVSASVETLSAADLYSGNDETSPEAIVPINKTVPAGAEFTYTFPRASFTVLTLPRE